MKKTVLKALLLSFIMAMCSVMPLHAQTDGFFRGGSNDNYSNRDEISSPGNDTNGISNNGIGQPEPSPLGSGLLIMVAAGAGYAVARRKRSRNDVARRIPTLLLAFALLLGMTQCKKKVETITEASTGMHITLTVDDGSKVIVDPYGHVVQGGTSWATVTYEDGDVIYVGNGSEYIGSLTYKTVNDVSYFEGNIDENKLPGYDDYLYFYFLGNKIPYETATAGATTLSVNIIDQTAKYPVISYARSNELFDPNEHSYSAYLLNYCAIQKFTTNVDKVIKLKGMKNKVTLDFTNTSTPYSYDYVDSEGAILLHRESATERWAIVLPQGEITAASATAAGYGTTSTFGVHQIARNGYYPDPIIITLAANGIIDGKISIWPGQDTQGNPTGDPKYAYFASGNLQYKASENKWRFAENQWDIVGDDNANISSTYTGWIDLFGWATSGWDPSLSTYYHPYDVANFDYNYGPHAANTGIGVYTTPYWNTLYQQTESIMHIGTTNCDWGKYLSSNNMITNGGGKLYRTLSFYDGMYFSLYRRNDIRGELKTLIGFGRVHGVFGYIVLPDNWDGTIDPDFKYYNIDMTASPPVIPESIEVNEFTDAEWVVMEAYGVGFAPAAGRRILDSESDTDPDKQTVTKLDNVGDICYYWTSTAPADYSGDLPYRAHVGKFGDSKNPLVMGSDCRSYGCSVRLIYVPSEQN